MRGGEPPMWRRRRWTTSSSRTAASSVRDISRRWHDMNVQARKGVLLAAGGFSRNADMRRRFSGDQPNDGKWSIANAGDTGEVLQTAMEARRQTDLLDEAWWLPMVFLADPGAASLGSGRQRPGAIYVDGTGRRFCNESNSYVEVGKAMYANKAVPCWQVFDEGYVGRYVSGANPLKKRTLSDELIDAGCCQTCRHDRRSGSPDRCSRRSVGADGPALQRVRGQGTRPRLRTRPVGLQRRASATQAIKPERRARSDRQGAVLRHPRVPGRRRHLRGSDHQRARPGAERDRTRSSTVSMRQAISPPP